MKLHLSMTTTRRLAVSAGLLAALGLAACSAAPAATATPAVAPAAAGVIAQGRLEPASWVDVSFSLGGTLAQVPVSEGQAVQAGDVLAVLAPPADQALNQQRAAEELTLAQLALAAAQDGGANALAQAALAQASAERAVEVAQTRLDDLELAQTDAPEDERPTDLEVAEAEAQVAAAQAAAAEAADRYDLLNANDGLDPDRLAAAQARVASAQAAVDALAAANDLLTLRAPAAGTVVGLDLQAGERVAPGQLALTLADFSRWVVQTDDLTELEVVAVKPGDTATLRFDALPDLALTGTVESLAARYEEKRGDITYTVTLSVADVDPLLRWGMTAAVTFGE